MVLKVLICDEGSSVTCAILRIVTEIGQGPDGFEWAASIIIPAVAAIAAVLVLAFSVRTAREASRQAQTSENARVAGEQNRLENERLVRVNAAIGHFLAAIPERLTELTAFSDALATWKYNKLAEPYVSDPKPERPGASKLLTLIAAAKLEANAAERQFFDCLTVLVVFGKNDELIVHRQKLIVIVEIVVEWRQASVLSKRFLLQRARELQEAVDLDRVAEIRKSDNSERLLIAAQPLRPPQVHRKVMRPDGKQRLPLYLLALTVLQIALVVWFIAPNGSSVLTLTVAQRAALLTGGASVLAVLTSAPHMKLSWAPYRVYFAFFLLIVVTVALTGLAMAEGGGPITWLPWAAPIAANVIGALAWFLKLRMDPAPQPRSSIG